MSPGNPGTFLDWDSGFWGIRIGQVAGDTLDAQRVVEIDDWAGASSLECLYFLARSDDPETMRIAQATGFDLVDVRMQLSRPVDDGGRYTRVREYESSDLPELREIAGSNHDQTRFFADAHFSRDRCSELYATWIEASCNGWADVVLVAEQAGRVAGYVTCHLDARSSEASIGLIGVAGRQREQGLGGELVAAALGWCRDRDLAELSVVTQGSNVRAQRLFQGCGFRSAQLGLWFHKWYRT